MVDDNLQGEVDNILGEAMNKEAQQATDNILAEAERNGETWEVDDDVTQEKAEAANNANTNGQPTDTAQSDSQQESQGQEPSEGYSYGMGM